jgi:hypothetical protein
LASGTEAVDGGPRVGTGLAMGMGRDKGPGMGRGPGMGGPCGGDARVPACVDGGRPTWGARRGHRAWAPGGPIGSSCEEHFKAFDENGNGTIESQEFAAWPHAHGDANAIFAARDEDHDGVLTKDEFCGRWNRTRQP